jgi:hypothetical protein
MGNEKSTLFACVHAARGSLGDYDVDLEMILRCNFEK